MNTEEIKMIVDLLSAATDGAKEILIILLAKDIFISTLGYCLAFIGFFFVYKLVSRIIVNVSIVYDVINILENITQKSYTTTDGVKRRLIVEDLKEIINER